MHCEDNVESFMKGYCLSIVQDGVNKCIFIETIIEKYEVTMNGKGCWQSFLSSLSAISKTIIGTEKGLLIKDNINIMKNV